MKMIAGMILAVALMGTGFYARGYCQPLTVMQPSQDIQVAAMPADTQNAFSKLAAHLSRQK